MRLLSAVVGIPIAILVVFVGGLPFALTVLALSLIGLWELSRFMEQRGWWVIKPLAIPLLALAILGAYFGSDNPNWLLPGFVVLWWGSVFGCLFVHIAFRQTEATAPPVGWRLSSIGATLLSVWYLALFAFLVLLRQQQATVADQPYPLGRDLVFLVLLTVWGTDSVAFFFGRAFGREPLAPLVSPGKTLEGSVAGTVAGFLIAWLFAWGLISFGGSEATTKLWLHLAQPVPFTLLALALGTVGQLGDLGKSVIKRELGIKDFGALIPGHGGVLDRFDSLLATAPLVYFYVRWVIP